MSKKISDKKRPPQVENPSKTFKIFAVSFHGLNLEAMEKELLKQMEVRSSKKIYAVMVNGAVGEQQTKEEEFSKTNQIADGIRKCREDFEIMWESLTSSLSDDLKRYWNGDREDDENKESGAIEVDESWEILPKKLKAADLMFLNSEIGVVKECDYFLVVFGKFSAQTLIELIRSNQPLQAIIHFIPCPESDLDVNFPELHTHIDYLKKSPDTKNVGIFIESLMMLPASEYFQEEKYSKQIYDQFTWYLYDIEMLTQQFIAYQADFLEINDTESPSQEELLWTKFAQVKPNRDTNNDSAVGVYLDNLCSTIGNHTSLGVQNSFCRDSPFLENNYGKIIVEEGNELLKSAVSNQMDIATYWRLIDIIVVNATMDSVCKRNSEASVELPEFYELLSWESFAQRLEAKKTLFDDCSRIDITDKCKLFILHRALNQIFKVQRKFQLPTKLCLRDFCIYLVPDLIEHIRNHGLKPKYSGIKWEDTLQELTSSEQIFRWEDGSICSSVESWLNKNQSSSIKIRLFGCSVYCHRLDDLQSECKNFRIMTENNITCCIEKGDSPNQQNISIQWPNGCLIRYSNKEDVEFLEQKYERKDCNEIRRLYTAKGCALRYLVNGTIEILTPNGIVYTLFPKPSVCDDLEYFQPLVQDDVSKEREFVRSFQIYGVSCEYFDVVRSDGRKLRVANEDLVAEVATFLVYEWTDYGANKKFLDREDGLKMVWSAETLKCYYPCGTVIATTVAEDFISSSFGCPNIMENIFEKFNPAFISKGAKEATRQDTYITYKPNYLMQHKNNATIAVCGEDKMAIYSPDEFKLILKEDNVVLIDIGEKFSFRIAAGVCTIRSGASISENKSFTLGLNLFRDDGQEILTFQNANALLKLDASGEMKLSQGDESLLPNSETLYFLSRDNEFGMEFMSKEKHKNLRSTFKDNKYLFNSPTTTVLLTPLFPNDEQFSMPIPGFDEDLENFQPTCCKKSKRKEYQHHVFTARVVHKHPPIQSDYCNFVQNFVFTDSTLADQLNEGLCYFFDKKVKSTHSPKWKAKLEKLRNSLECKRQRMQFYRQMLNQNAFPNFFHFANDCKQDVKLLRLNTNLKTKSNKDFK